MKKNVIIYIVAGAIVLAGLATGGVIAYKKYNENQPVTTTESNTLVNEEFDDFGYTIVEEPSSIEALTNGNGELIEIVTDANGNPYEVVLVTDANGEVVTDANGEKVTAPTKPAGTTVPGATTQPTTKKPATTKKPSTTKKASSGGLSTGDKVDTHNNTVEIDDKGNANIVKPDGTIALSYSYDAVGNYFYTDDDPWQRNFGFNRLYDIGAVFTVMYIDTMRAIYNYGDYEWMVQFWKGQYGFLFLGGEVGLYYKEPGKASAHYNCATEAMEINMQMTVFREGYGELFTRPYDSHWWITAFVPGKLVKFSDRSELTMIAKLTFKSEAECILFCKALEKITDVDGNRFRPTTTISKNNPETYKRNGATVDIVWRYLDEDRVTPTKPVVTTTKAPETTTVPPTTAPEDPSATTSASTTAPSGETTAAPTTTAAPETTTVVQTEPIG